MEWAVLGLFIMFLIVTYIVVQGTRAALAWRQAAASGDVKVIREIVEDAAGLGASVLIKPFELDQLATSVERALTPHVY